MRVRTWSACVALAWGILLIVTAAGPIGSLRPAQATTRIASSTSNTSTTTRVTLTSSVTTTLSGSPTSAPAGRPAGAEASAAARPGARPTAQDGVGTRTGAGTHTSAATPADVVTRAGARAYVVQPGDTLSGIAAALGTAGGWPALYAANRLAIGIYPGLIHPGLILALPVPMAATHYKIAAGDTLSGIAAALGTAGGWPALYAANRRVIGPDPDVIHAGTVLAIPHAGLPASPRLHQVPSASPAPHRTVQPSESAPATAPSGRPASAQPLTGARSHPRSAQVMPMGGLPRWLEIVLVAAGLLIATAFLTEPVLAP